MLANLITLSRILILPIIIYLLAQQTMVAAFWAVAFMFIAVLTDIFDGILARTTHSISKVGSFLDPFADKVLVMGLFVTFYLLEEFSGLVLAFFILRDFVSGAIRWVAARDDIVIKSEIFANLLLYFQFILIFGLLLKNFLIVSGLPYWLTLRDTTITMTTIAAILIAIFSVLHYGYVYNKGLRKIRHGNKIKENLVILANRRSRGYKHNYRRHLLKVFSTRRDAKIIYLKAKKNMYQGVDVKKFQHIIIAGGDGSFESAINYKPLQAKSLGFFPLGGGNFLFSHFYRGKRFEYLRSRFPFKETTLDVLELTWEQGKVQTFVLSAGIDAEVIRLSKRRKYHNFKDYFAAGWQAFFHSSARHNIKVIMDNRKYHWKNCVGLNLGKVSYYGYGIRSIFHAKPNDGIVYGIATVNKHLSVFNKPLRMWSMFLAHLGVDKPPVQKLSGKKITVTSEVPMPLQAGGDFLGYTQKFSVKVIRKQKVLVI